MLEYSSTVIYTPSHESITIAGVKRSTTNCGPLNGLRVLDLTRAVAGPFCTMLLGDLGARVMKIEEPEGGDETRHWGQASEGGESAYFLALNRNKESVALDLKQERGLAALHKLACEADVLVQNFRPGVVERLGIDYETLRAGNAGLVYASISGFGLTETLQRAPGIRPDHAGHERDDDGRLPSGRGSGPVPLSSGRYSGWAVCLSRHPCGAF